MYKIRSAIGKASSNICLIPPVKAQADSRSGGQIGDI